MRASRITSYNVCYTTFLRIDSPTGRHHYVAGDLNTADVWIDAQTPGQAGYNDSPIDGSEWHTYLLGGIRITSYNVCYTKLLRGRQALVVVGERFELGVLLGAESANRRKDDFLLEQDMGLDRATESERRRLRLALRSARDGSAQLVERNNFV